MKTSLTLAIALLLSGTLTACNKVADAPTPPAATNQMVGMTMSTAVKVGSGTGKVTAIDQANGKITIAHGAIAAVGWPAMTMTFSVKPKLLMFAGVKVGNQIKFEMRTSASGPEVTSVRSALRDPS